LNLVYCCHTSQ